MLTASFILVHAGQSSWSKASSMDTTGYLSMNPLYTSNSWSDVSCKHEHSQRWSQGQKCQGQGQGHDHRGQGQEQGLEFQGQDQGQGHNHRGQHQGQGLEFQGQGQGRQLPASGRLEVKAMASRTPSLLLSSTA